MHRHRYTDRGLRRARAVRYGLTTFFTGSAVSGMVMLYVWLGTQIPR